ncbi:hypothetical protein Tgr7_3062 [Thioalkalivibrio sulfidiphilus HL-EbGr7]|uniref:Uncharacterized protein n=1 Tax=Thioalkalivibrio sulfidiphilus (strain HL-EbGR7) TaxID=396588 RepID=B8GPY4_THISH|nr:hypothetical protein [Thioalkalivibrio sulfidiphilus]ACL74131.1 hypothetical protein Tgr7_3062 [Thioalkalivibrio sulfidiphilus HL-EbGr7]
MAHQTTHCAASCARPVQSRQILRVAASAAILATLISLPFSSHGDEDAYGPLTQTTAALNQDFAREQAFGQQILRSSYSQPAYYTRELRISAQEPRNRAMVYPAGDGGVMVEMNFRY